MTRIAKLFKFPTNNHPSMNGGISDFVDMWVSGFSSSGSCRNGCVQDGKLLVEQLYNDSLSKTIS